MQVYLDGEQILSGRGTLRDIVESAITRAHDRGRVIIEVEADGSPVPGELLADPPDEPLEAGEIRFTSAEPRLMVRETLLQAVDALDHVERWQREAGGQISAGRLAEARESLEPALTTWRHVMLAIERSGTLLGIDVESVAAASGGRTVAEAVSELSDHLRELRRALEDQDVSMIADLLEDELNEQAHRWRNMLRALAEHVQREGAA